MFEMGFKAIAKNEVLPDRAKAKALNSGNCEPLICSTIERNCEPIDVMHRSAWPARQTNTLHTLVCDWVVQGSQAKSSL